MKRLVVAIILFTMVLHSASRLGVLSYLYQQRHEIAHAIGVIAEIPIAICSSDYDGNSGLHIIAAADDTDSTLPPAVLQAKEIQLFFNGLADLVPDPSSTVFNVQQSAFVEKRYAGPILSIFHPPS